MNAKSTKKIIITMSHHIESENLLFFLLSSCNGKFVSFYQSLPISSHPTPQALSTLLSVSMNLTSL